MRKSQAETNLPKAKTFSDGQGTELVIGLLNDSRLYISIEECADEECVGNMCCIYLPTNTTVELTKWLINQIMEQGLQHAKEILEKSAKS